MKKITYLLLSTMFLFVFNGCKKDSTGTKDINYISFEANVPTIIVEKDGSINTDVHVYTTQTTGSDRTFSVEIDADATSANAETYTVAATVTVPANSNVGTLTIGVADNNLGEDPETLVLRIGASDGLFVGNKLSLLILKHCSFNPSLTVGSYRAVSAGWGVDGNVTITADPGDSHKVYVTGLETIDGVNEDKGPLPLIISDDNSVTVPKTILASSAFGYTDLAYAGDGSYNSCNGSFSLSMTVSVSVGTFGTYTWTLTRN